MNSKELKRHKKEITLELSKSVREYEKSQTNHILHLLLSVVTGGIWLLVWLAITNKNQHRRTYFSEIINESESALAEIDNKLNFKERVECPWCAEEILLKAKICKHCGKDVLGMI